MGPLVGRRVVIVEDEGVTQMQLGRVLARFGMSVVGSAMNGPMGVEMVLRERPDIVLMDINMPGPFDGLEAARRISAKVPTCIVMLTAYREYEERARQAGAYGYVTKPILGESLLPQLSAAYTEYLHHKQAHAVDQ